MSRQTAGVTCARLVRHGQSSVESDGLQDELAVRGEALHPSHHPVGDVTGQALYEHGSPVGVVLRQLGMILNIEYHSIFVNIDFYRQINQKSDEFLKRWCFSIFFLCDSSYITWSQWI